MPEKAAVNLNVELQPSAGENQNWWGWSKVYCAQTRYTGCDTAFDMPKEEAIKVGMDEFDDAGVNPVLLHETDVACRPLITTCKGVAFEVADRRIKPGRS